MQIEQQKNVYKYAHNFPNYFTDKTKQTLANKHVL